ncbi:hypothetical protein EMPS_04623 [Entomortierella parvispora]|uniref:Major facilitator superfamily (MFS) profile domain-containing protein n=1 Tax=Entomortierella parvispora TaxID=205924 RepID=A0A9P3LVK5_9FUNG|nr:hypothetical protein EMPS_04623 [Entomortierella parvispora]
MSTSYSHSPEQEPLLESDDSRSYTDETPEQEIPSPLSADEAEDVWMAELARRPWYRRPSIYWLCPFLFFLAITAGFEGSPTAQLRIRIICRDIVNATPPIIPSSLSFSDEEDLCKTPEVLAQVAVILSRIQATEGIISLMTLTWWTSLSDKYGRVFLLRWSVLVSIIATCIQLYAAAPRNLSGTTLLTIGGVFQGATATGHLYNPAVLAYVADCTPALTRSMQIGLTLSAFSMGGIIGPFLGGYTTKVTEQLTTALWIVVVLFALLYMLLLFIPESLKPKARNSSQNMVPGLVHGAVPKSGSTLLRVAETIKQSALSIFKPFKMFLPNNVVVSERMPSKYIPSLLLLAKVIIHFVAIGQSSNFYPMTNLLFHWGAYEDGIFLSGMGIVTTVTFIVIFPLLQKAYKSRYNIEESSSTGSGETSFSAVPTTEDVDPAPSNSTIRALKMDISFYLYGLAIIAIGFSIFPIFLTVSTLVTSEIMTILGSIGATSGMSVITTIMPADHTGMVMGALSVIDSIASTAAVLSYGQIFAKTSSTTPQAYYFLSLSLMITAGLVVMPVWTFFHRPNRKTAGRMA